MSDKKKKTLKEKFSKIKRKEVVIAVIAVVIMLAIYFSSSGGEKKNEQQSVNISSSYCDEIKRDALSAIIQFSGDKKAQIAIGWESSEEEIIAYITSQNGNTANQSPSIIQSSGASKPIILKTIYPKAIGAVVVFKGARDKQNIRHYLLDKT